jgi:hypothetical protein
MKSGLKSDVREAVDQPYRNKLCAPLQEPQAPWESGADGVVVTSRTPFIQA